MPELPPLIGESPAFLALAEQISRVAPLDRPVLVIGERGTGKELVAARLHFLSQCWGGPFVKLNCAALAESLLETELFGHEAGAFTGAAKRRAGRFELADGGSLFLDEIAAATPAVQEKLLRVIEYGAFERVGGNTTLSVEVRVIGATNEDLPAAASEGRFRADLLDRLAFEVITLPPLRARPEDIPLLSAHFGREMANELDWPQFPGFSESAVDQLLNHPWPGNVRELRNVVERSVARSHAEAPVDRIVLDPFASPYPLDPGPSARSGERDKPERPAAAAEDKGAGVLSDPLRAFDLREALKRVEHDLLQQALTAQRFNQRATAKQLGLTYDQLRNRLRKHGLLERPA
ncbi:phage shock protein operon transcriptional activator [Pelagibius litoralis]|uniref:Phage shock protein operon transcriptional activator n=1 Tax=Pelagibius litoralis TaxID=374515 RepID=A0A967C5V9_9PROT|nr:phage shock protein operon transcriptional activator [Pelagibius litoralis]NIA68021.1 phage shock protein operon transcriptional activator [Pelagibius litoralis]